MVILERLLDTREKRNDKEEEEKKERSYKERMESIKSFFGWQEVKPAASCYHIYGFMGCPYFQQAMCVGRELQKESGTNVTVNINISARPTWKQDIKDISEKHKTETNGHETCPIIFEGCGDVSRFVGGYSEFSELAYAQHKFRSTKCNR